MLHIKSDLRRIDANLMNMTHAHTMPLASKLATLNNAWSHISTGYKGIPSFLVYDTHILPAHIPTATCNLTLFIHQQSLLPSNVPKCPASAGSTHNLSRVDHVI